MNDELFQWLELNAYDESGEINNHFREKWENGLREETCDCCEKVVIAYLLEMEEWHCEPQLLCQDCFKQIKKLLEEKC